MKIHEYLKGKLKYDNNGQFIWLIQPNGNYQKFADLRGWGAIQNLFADKKGKINIEEAAKFQDDLGQWMVDVLNKQISDFEELVNGKEVI